MGLSAFLVVLRDVEGERITVGGSTLYVSVFTTASGAYVTFPTNSDGTEKRYTDNGDGTYSIQFTTYGAGDYNAVVRLGDASGSLIGGVASYPFTVVIGPISYKSIILATAPIPSRVTAGATVQFGLQGRNSLGYVSERSDEGDAIAVTIRPEPADSTFLPTISSSSVAEYLVQLTAPTKSGRYGLSVSVYGKLLLEGGSSDLIVQAGPIDISMSEVLAESPSYTDNILLSVQTKDTHGNPTAFPVLQFTAVFTDESGAVTEFTNFAQESAGSYALVTDFITPGRYTVDVNTELQGELTTVGSTVMTVNVGLPSVLSTYETLPEFVGTGVPTYFTISAYDVFNHKATEPGYAELFSLRVVGSKTGRSATSAITIRDRAGYPGEYQAMFQATLAGDVLTVTLLVSGQPVEQGSSTCRVMTLPAFDAGYFTLVETASALVASRSAGEDAQFLLRLSTDIGWTLANLNERTFQVALTGPDGQAVANSITGQFAASKQLDLTLDGTRLRTSGNYTFVITLDGYNVLRSPVSFVVVASAPDLTLSYIEALSNTSLAIGETGIVGIRILDSYNNQIDPTGIHLLTVKYYSAQNQDYEWDISVSPTAISASVLFTFVSDTIDVRVLLDDAFLPVLDGSANVITMSILSLLPVKVRTESIIICISVLCES